jgi:hypothetical protein
MRIDERLRRAARLQRRLQDIEYAKLARTEARLNLLREEEQQLVDHLERDDSMATLFPEALLGRLQEARRLRQEAMELHASQRDQAMERRRRARQTERLADSAEEEHARESAARERRELLDLLSALSPQARSGYEK